MPPQCPAPRVSVCPSVFSPRLAHSLQKIASTVTWSRPWPSSWSSAGCKTSTWPPCPAPTTRCTCTWAPPEWRRAPRSRTTGSSSGSSSGTQTWSPRSVSAGVCISPWTCPSGAGLGRIESHGGQGLGCTQRSQGERGTHSPGLVTGSPV